MGQLILGAAGAVVGSLFGMPQLGWTIGSMIGAGFGPTQKSEGPRLGDLKVTGTDYGQPIPWVQGHPIIAGQLWWSSPRREIATTTEVGKGAPSAENTTYTYEVDLLIGLTDNVIAGVTRVFLNGKLVATFRGDATADSLQASAQTEHWRRFTVYTGEATQLPDPTYEAAVGTANAPAYRGRGSVFIEGLQLGSSGQIPNITVEVTTSGAGGSIDGSEWSSVRSGAGVTLSNGDMTAENLSDTYHHSLTKTELRSGKYYWEVVIDELGDPNDVYIGVRSGLLGTYDARVVDAAYQPRVCLRSDGTLYHSSTDPSYTGTFGAPSTIMVAVDVDHSLVWFGYNGVWFGDPANGVAPASVMSFFTGGSTGVYPCWGPDNNVGTTRVTIHPYTETFTFTPPAGFDPLPKALDTLTPANETLEDVVSRLCLRSGLTAGQFDASGLAPITKPVRALSVAQVGPTRNVLDLLASAYYFESVLSDKIYFRPRGGSSVVTIPFNDLGASLSETGDPQPLALRPLNELEIPAQVAVTYMNVDTECQSDTQYSDRMISSARTTNAVSLPLGFTAAEAKGIADSMVMDQIASALTTRLMLPRSYSRYEPTDVVTVIGDDGSSYRLRIVRKTDNGSHIDSEVVLDDSSVLSAAGVTSDDYTPAMTVTPPADTVLELLDIPIGRDADNTPGIMAAAKGTVGIWPGAAVYRSPDDVDFTQVATISESAVIGIATSALGDFEGGDVFDMASTLTVDVGQGELTSTTRTALLADGAVNVLLVGTEIVRFLSAALVDAGIYTLTGFLRGQRGTEHAIGGHVENERVVLIRPHGLRRINHSASDIGVARHYKGVSIGRRLSTAESEEFTDTGIALKPFAPVNARGSRDASGNMVVSWFRRTRLATRFTGTAGINVPLGEDSEAYEVDVFSDGTFSTVLRTLTSSTQSANYTPDMVAEDFGPAQSVLYVRVYQLSATVGRGYPLEAAVNFGSAAPVPVVVYTGTGASRAVISNIDTRTGGSVLAKGLAGIGTPNAHVFNVGGVAVDLNTSATTAAIASTGTTINALGLSLGASSSLNSSAMKMVAVFLPRRAGLFDRISWTGDGSGNRDIAHALGVAPALALVARRDTADLWKMYSAFAGAGQSLSFPTSSGAAFGSDATSFPNAATTTDLRIGSGLNVSGAPYEALLFSSDSALAETGTYTGNGSASGPSVSLGFLPKLLIIRSLGATNRHTFVTTDELDGEGFTHWHLDDQGAAAVNGALVTLSSSGFDVVSANGTVNENAVGYQFVAFQPWT